MDQQVIEKLEALARELGTTAAEFWPTYVEYQLIIMIVGCIVYTVTIFGLGAATLVMYRVWLRNQNEWAGGVTFAAGVCLVAALIVGILILPSAIASIAAPEVYAMERLIRLIN